MKTRVRALPVFALAATFSASAQPSYYKHPDYNAVIEARACEDRGLCGRVVAIDPQDDGVREKVGQILRKKKSGVTDEDVLSFCGMEGDVKLSPDGRGKWKGTVYWPFRNATYGISIKYTENGAEVRGWIPWMPMLKRSVELERVEAPAAMCVKPLS